MTDRTPFRIGILLLILLYVLVRFWHLADNCLWFDEIFSVHAAEHSWRSLFHFISLDLIHPPLFYILLKIWVAIGGESVLWLRSLSVLFASAALIPFVCLCRELKIGRTAVLISLAFLAANGALIKYAQEVRMYSLLLCLSLFSIWIFVRFFKRGKNIWLLTAINVALVHSHYFGWFVVVSEVIAILFLQRIKLRQIAIMGGITFAAFLPWMFYIYAALSGNSNIVQNLGWMNKPQIGDIASFSLSIIEPFYYQQSSIDPSSHLYLTIPILLIILVSIVVYYSRPGKNEDDSSLVLLAIFAAVPIFLTLLISLISPLSIWGTRHLIICFAPLSLMAGTYVSRLFPHRIGWVAVLAFAALYVTEFIERAESRQLNYVWCAWGQLAPGIKGDGEQKLYVFEDLVAYHFWFATRDRGDVQVIKVNDVPEMTEDKAYFLPRGFEAVSTVSLDAISGDHFWIAFRDMKWDERHPPLGLLKERGYSIGEPETIDADGLKAFLVEVSK